MANPYKLADFTRVPGANTLKRDTATLLRKLEASFKSQGPQRTNWTTSGYTSVFGLIGFRMRATPRLMRALNYLEMQFPGQVKRITYEIHQSIALETMEVAERTYRRARKRSRRPAATGRLGKFLDDPRQYEKIIRYATGSMSINFNSMDLFLTNRGYPYWRSVNYGYRRRTIESGLFVSAAGRFVAPMPGRWDPKLAQGVSRGVTFDIEFGGYDFVGPAIEFANNAVLGERGYNDRLREGLSEIRQVDAVSIVKFFIGGNTIDRSGRPRTPDGKWASGPIKGWWPSG